MLQNRMSHFFGNVYNMNNNKQLLTEFEHDIKNYQGRGLCYPPKPKAEVDNTNRGLDNSRYHAKTEFNNCFNMYSKRKKRHERNR